MADKDNFLDGADGTMTLDGADIFYVSEKALDQLKQKLKDGAEIDTSLLLQFANPEKIADEEMMVPIDLQAVDEQFDDDLIDENANLDVNRMVEKMGAKGAAEALVKAQQIFETNSVKEPEDERAKKMTAKEWKDTMNGSSEDPFSDIEGLEGEEEENEGEEEEEEP
mmetsp:Transcript_112505/g.318707  ORF Transcript_112505/g.318707 Transcript_112505/m.318707 type:complete len:167 (+) Transcript_112505:77-577(+)